jgi:hypothetical protein
MHKVIELHPWIWTVRLEESDRGFLLVDRLRSFLAFRG